MKLYKIILILLFWSSLYKNLYALDVPEPPLKRPMLLTSLLLNNLQPGIYESDNMELILSYPLRHFEPGDVVIFDIDQVLITDRAKPFVLLSEKKSVLYEQLQTEEKHTKEAFLFYLFVSQSPLNVALMDKRTPHLIRELQLKNIKCMGNTALDANLGLTENYDMATARIKLLEDLGIDFSSAFPHLPTWGFDTLDRAHIKNCAPLFKKGIIFSSLIPKYLTQSLLLEKVKARPRKIVFIDDTFRHLQNMYDAMNRNGIECYFFYYTQKITAPLRDYFSSDFLNSEFENLEDFLENLLTKKNTDKFFRETPYNQFILHLEREPGWRLWK